MNCSRTNTDLTGLLAKAHSWPMPPPGDIPPDCVDLASALLELAAGPDAYLARLEDEEGLAGCGLVRLLDWDTGFFHRPCAVIEHIAAAGDAVHMHRVAGTVADDLLSWCRSRGVEFVAAKMPGPNPSVCRALEDRGFRLVDAVAALSRSGLKPPLRAPRPAGFRFAFSADNPGKVSEAFRRLFYDGRFHNDPLIPAADADRLWQTAVANHIRDEQSKVLLLLERSNPAGISVVRPLDKDPSRRRASLFVFGIRPEYRRKGLGRVLLTETLARFAAEFESLEVQTSTYNTPALRLYRSLGFEQESTLLSFHWHAEEHQS
jgi:ribosomal protein S18 acetylase RimI-like enzyme